ncbi:hypothetical protein FJY70_01325 [candidate division WOR-3 bacterium]|nr:hypothetical protein [candidate division WOR-3 bacterium]
MRRIVLVLVLVAAFLVAGYMLLRPKRGPARAKSTRSAVRRLGDDDQGATGSKAVRGSRRSARADRASGSLKASTREERRARTKQLRAEERRRQKELKRLEREKRRRLKGSARASRGRRKTRKGGEFYVLKAVISAGGENYALIDGRRAQVGDVVMGQRILSIGPERIEVEAFGRRSTVRVGESLIPTNYGAGGR